MEPRRSNWLAPMMATAIVLAFAVAYVTAYFATGQATYASPGGPVAARIYPSRWLTTLFTPAAKVESAISGSNVEIAWADGNMVWQSAPP